VERWLVLNPKDTGAGSGRASAFRANALVGQGWGGLQVCHCRLLALALDLSGAVERAQHANH
jgi:hypothetical protein